MQVGECRSAECRCPNNGHACRCAFEGFEPRAVPRLLGKGITIYPGRWAPSDARFACWTWPLAGLFLPALAPPNPAVSSNQLEPPLDRRCLPRIRGGFGIDGLHLPAQPGLRD